MDGATLDRRRLLLALTGVASLAAGCTSTPVAPTLGMANSRARR